MKPDFLRTMLPVCALIGLPLHADAIVIEFDYTYDTRGFFTDTLDHTPRQNRRDRLEQAASFFTDFRDRLAPIAPDYGDAWSVSFPHPSLGGPAVTLANANIAADTVRIYVGGSPSAPGVLGFAGTGFNLSASGSSAFVDAVSTRGQANASGPSATDFAPWGGYIWFNASHDWYFGADASGLTPGKPDFLTTAMHEIGHILGFGEADSWHARIRDGLFHGPESQHVHGGPVPVDFYHAHWAEGIDSLFAGDSQGTLMDPSTTRGVRELPTRLDLAGFQDIGWEIAHPVPLPAAAWLFVSAMAFLLWHGRRPRETTRLANLA